MALKLKKPKTPPKKVIKKVVKPVPTTAKGQKSSGAVVLPVGEYVEGVGRRKVATSRVRIYPKTKGEFSVNGLVVGQYFSGVHGAVKRYNRPLEITGTQGQFAISATVSGSGKSGQLDAVVHGLARALVKFNPEYRALLKPVGLLTRDDRMKETRKIGMGGKARRSRQSPKR